MSEPLLWEPAFATGDAVSDRRRHALIALCNALADPGDFDAAYAGFKSQARAHFDAEALRFAEAPDTLDDLEFERGQFDALVDEVATPANFEPAELQRFVAVWLLGHLRDGARLSASTNATAAARTASLPGP